ncbi:MAG TPA: DUF4194 domain-containing protein [Bacilli bacterium]|nr:DUF4194 domain-containing protein [Bacilli bacterium]
MFEEDVLKLSRADQDQFARVINSLLLSSFCVRDYFDRREKTIKINSQFRFIERHFDLIGSYLAYSGWRLEKDLLAGVFYIINEYEDNRIRFDREVSLVLFVLRLIYETEKSESSQTSESVYLTTPLVLKVMYERSISLPNKKINGRMIGRALKVLSDHNIVTKVSGSYDEGNATFYLLPSILYAVDQQKIVAISEALDKLNGSSLSSEEEGE